MHGDECDLIKYIYDGGDRLVKEVQAVAASYIMHGVVIQKLVSLYLYYCGNIRKSSPKRVILL